MKKNKVFLGGTCNGSTWREEIIKLLTIDYFNPVVKDWTPEFQKQEIVEKQEYCNKYLYYITPKMTGVFSIAEVAESAILHGSRCVFCYVIKDGDKEFTPGQIKSLDAVGNLVSRYGGYWAKDLTECAHYLNTYDPDSLIFDEAERVRYDKQ